MFNNYLSLKENSIVFTINLDNLKKENNYFYQIINSNYSESIDKIEEIDFHGFFYDNCKDLKNFKRDNDNIIYITNAIESMEKTSSL